MVPELQQFLVPAYSGSQQFQVTAPAELQLSPVPPPEFYSPLSMSYINPLWSSSSYSLPAKLQWFSVPAHAEVQLVTSLAELQLSKLIFPGGSAPLLTLLPITQACSVLLLSFLMSSGPAQSLSSTLRPSM